jgi:hypothetical protein
MKKIIAVSHFNLSGPSLFLCCECHYSGATEKQAA